MCVCKWGKKLTFLQKINEEYHSNANFYSAMLHFMEIIFYLEHKATLSITTQNILSTHSSSEYAKKVKCSTT
jgi:hypothetical protein